MDGRTDVTSLGTCHMVGTNQSFHLHYVGRGSCSNQHCPHTGASREPQKMGKMKAKKEKSKKANFCPYVYMLQMSC